MRHVGAFVKLSPRRRRLFLFAVLLSLLARTGLGWFGFRRTTQLFGRIPSKSRDVDFTEIRWATTSAANQLPGTTCLPRALVAHTLCRRYGHESSIYVGVDRDAEDFAAHSWVESGGRIVVGDDVDLDRYERLGVVAA